jgi:hypothetical protein
MVFRALTSSRVGGDPSLALYHGGSHTIETQNEAVFNEFSNINDTTNANGTIENKVRSEAPFHADLNPLIHRVSIAEAAFGLGSDQYKALDEPTVIHFEGNHPALDLDLSFIPGEDMGGDLVSFSAGFGFLWSAAGKRGWFHIAIAGQHIPS